MHADCCRMFSFPWRKSDVGLWSDLDRKSLLAFQPTKRRVSFVLTPCASIASQTCVIIHQWGTTCQHRHQSSFYPISTQLGSESLNIIIPSVNCQRRSFGWFHVYALSRHWSLFQLTAHCFANWCKIVVPEDIFHFQQHNRLLQSACVDILKGAI